MELEDVSENGMVAALGRDITMNGSEHARYRLNLARGFLTEGEQNMQLGRWRSAVDNAQLTVENAAKAALALMMPVGRTHHPAPLLREAIDAGLFAEDVVPSVLRLAECAEQLGYDIHIQTDYGDETAGATPWELFGEEDAQEAIALAQESLALVERVIQSLQAP